MTEEHSDIRAFLESEAAEAPQPSGIRDAIVRRARLGRVALVVSSLLGVVVIAGGTLVAANAVNDAGPPAPAHPAESPPSQSAITFSRFSPDGGIFVMQSDGSGAQRVLRSQFSDLDEPAWSPDGTKIAFHGFFGEARNQAGGLFVMNADGTDLRLLQLGGDAPTWSPDGTRIAFVAGGRLMVIPASGGESRSLSNTRDVESPAWSPDGDQIAFAGTGLFVVNADGTRHRRVIVADKAALHPAWSPDGSEIAFTSYPDDEDPSTVEIVEADGTDRRTLTQGADPTWSPDGTRIAFERIDGNVSHIYSMNLDGTDLQQLTFGPESDHSPEWAAVNVADTTPGGPECGTIDLGRDEYGTTLDRNRGPADTEVTLSGTTLRGEDGRWAPSDRLEAWWNTDVPTSEVSNAQPLRSGPVVKLVEVDDMERCYFEATFTVPNVEPGRYKISVFVWDANPENGYGFFLPHRFTVTEG